MNDLENNTVLTTSVRFRKTRGAKFAIVSGTCDSSVDSRRGFGVHVVARDIVNVCSNIGEYSRCDESTIERIRREKPEERWRSSSR